MYTDQLVHYGRKLVKNFIGVFPLNKLPKAIRPTSRFIVNTDTDNLPGTHWIAVSYEQGGIALVFDPLGLFYPYKLANYLANHARIVFFNYHMYQSPTEENCGQHCIAWLKWRSQQQQMLRWL